MPNTDFPKALGKFRKVPIFQECDLSEKAQIRHKGLTLWRDQIALGISVKDALTIVMRQYGHSSAYWYRWRKKLYSSTKLSSLESMSTRPHIVPTKKWDSAILKRISAIVHDESCMRWGKDKVHRLLESEEMHPPSVSTVGRMMAHLRKTGAIE